MVQAVSKIELYSFTSHYLAQLYFGLPLEKCKEMTYEFALKNNLAIPESWIKIKKAG